MSNLFFPIWFSPFTAFLGLWFSTVYVTNKFIYWINIYLLVVGYSSRINHNCKSQELIKYLFKSFKTFIQFFFIKNRRNRLSILKSSQSLTINHRTLTSLWFKKYSIKRKSSIYTNKHIRNMKMTLHSNDVDYISDKQKFSQHFHRFFSCIFSRFTDSIYSMLMFLLCFYNLCTQYQCLFRMLLFKKNERMNWK